MVNSWHRIEVSPGKSKLGVTPCSENDDKFTKHTFTESYISQSENSTYCLGKSDQIMNMYPPKLLS